jgi:hypothetical protein
MGLESTTMAVRIDGSLSILFGGFSASLWHIYSSAQCKQGAKGKQLKFLLDVVRWCRAALFLQAHFSLFISSTGCFMAYLPHQQPCKQGIISGSPTCCRLN